MWSLEIYTKDKKWLIRDTPLLDLSSILLQKSNSEFTPDLFEETGEIKVSINSNLNFTMWVFTWGLANDHDIHKKYETIAKSSTLSNLISEITQFNQTWKGGHNEKSLQ